MKLLSKVFKLILALLSILIILGTTTHFTQNNALEGLKIGLTVDISIVILLIIISLLRWCDIDDKPN